MKTRGEKRKNANYALEKKLRQLCRMGISAKILVLSKCSLPGSVKGQQRRKERPLGLRLVWRCSTANSESESTACNHA